MVSFRDKYRLLRRRALPASKADVTRLHENVKDEISDLRRGLDIDAEALARRVAELTHRVTELTRVADAIKTLAQNTEPRLEQGRKAVEEAGLEFSYSKLNHTVLEPELVPHSKWQSYLSRNFNKPDVRILEVGSRNVTGGTAKKFFSNTNYVGFDFYEGENVDVVGDAHKLSSYFGDQKFDLVLSAAVFEHLHMPWIVAHEIQKLLKIGGYVFVETHFSFSAHERPWNFFQFSDMGLRALFNSGLGFDLIDSGMSNPLNGVFSQDSAGYLKGKTLPELYCHSEILCRKSRDVPQFDWAKVNMDDVVNNTRYPPPQVIA
jgi:hypothetical protein